MTTVIGFTVWLVGDVVIRSTPQVGTLAECEAFWIASVPRDGILKIMQHYAETNIGETFRLRAHIGGNDWYFWAPTAERIVFNDDDNETNRVRYGADIIFSRGQWGTNNEMEEAEAASIEERIAL